jgi:hypothetical protein
MKLIDETTDLRDPVLGVPVELPAEPDNDMEKVGSVHKDSEERKERTAQNKRPAHSATRNAKGHLKLAGTEAKKAKTRSRKEIAKRASSTGHKVSQKTKRGVRRVAGAVEHGAAKVKAKAH